MVLFRKKRGRIYKIGQEFPDQFRKTVLLSAAIRAIYDSDAQLTPAEQQEAIRTLPGMTGGEMESIILQTGPGLADSIRSIISSHRATNRSYKDKHS